MGIHDVSPLRRRFPLMVLTGLLPVLASACKDKNNPAGSGTIEVQAHVAGGAQATSQAAPDSVVAVAARGSDMKRARIETNGSAGFAGRIEGLTPGDYDVVVQGMIGGETSLLGAAGRVTVNAGKTASATATMGSFVPALDAIPAEGMRPQIPLSWQAVAGADGYTIEFDHSEGFTAPTAREASGTSMLLTIPDSGMFYVRARARNAHVGVGRGSDARTTRLLVNTSEPSDNDPAAAVTLGMGAAANGTYGGLNVLPAGDSDWFAIGICTADTLELQTTAKALDPPSGLNTAIQVRDPRDTVVAANNDYQGSNDSYVRFVAARDGTHRFRVFSAGDTTVGHYELQVTVRPGPNVTTSSCQRVSGSPVSRVIVTPGSAAATSAGATRSFTAQAVDAGGAPVPGATVTWSSSNATVATIGTASGVATAVSSGQTTITASVDGVEGHAVLNVAVPGALAVAGWTAQSSGVSQDLHGIWGTSPTELYGAVGAGGRFVRYNGSGWSPLPGGVQGTLNHVWGLGRNHWYAVGTGGVIARYDGANVMALASGTTTTLNGIWGSSPVDLFAVGAGGTILRFDGSAWRPMNSGTGQDLHGIWGTAADNVFAVGAGGTVLRFNGSSWSSMGSGTSQALHAVWGLDGSSLWAVGEGGTILRFNGSSWSGVSSGTSAGLQAVWGTSSNDVYAVGSGGTILRYDGSSWVTMSSGTTQNLHGVAGSLSGQVYAVGAGGTVLRGTRGTTQAASRIVVTPGGAAAASVGNSVSFSAQALDAGGNPISGKSFSWITLNPDVATVATGTGVATAVAAGQAVIAATVDGVSGYGVLTVSDGQEIPVGRWYNQPFVTAAPLHAVWGTSSANIWAVGFSGLTLWYDGIGWRSTGSGTSQNLNGLHGSSAIDVYAVGAGGTIRHYDGGAWAGMNSGTGQTLHAVWAASPLDVFAVGDGGTILRFDGSSWSPMSSGTSQSLRGVWGTSRSNVFAVGLGGTILRFDGTNWNAMSSGTGTGLHAVWAASPQDVFAVGEGNTVLRYQGSSWSPMSVGGDLTTFRAVWGSSGSDVYAAGTHGQLIRYNGSGWTVERRPNVRDMQGIWGAPGGGVFAVGFDGSQVLGRRGPAYITVSPAGAAIAAGGTQAFSAQAYDANGTLMANPPLVWSTLNPAVLTMGPSGAATAVGSGQAIVAASMEGTDGYALATVSGGAGVAPATSWSPVSTPTSEPLRAIWGTGPGHVLAVGGNGTILRWNGSGWGTMASPSAEALNGVWAASTSAAFAMMTQGGKLKYEAGEWQIVPLPASPALHGIWGASPDALFAVGDEGAVLRYDGRGWARYPAVTTQGLRGIWGTAANNVYIVGEGGTILRYDGSGYSHMPTSGSWAPLRAVWGTSPGSVFAVGDGGTILRWNGSTWSAMTSGTTVNLRGVFGTSASDVYAVGDAGTILRYDGSAWTVVAPGSFTAELYAVWGTAGGPMWAVGAGGTILRGNR